METMEIETELVMELCYYVIMNDGVNEHFAEAAFRNKRDAINYANNRANDFVEYNPSDDVDGSALVAQYEVVVPYRDERDNEWETVYETKEFYNE